MAKTKKLLALILALLMAVSVLAGCGSNGDTADTEDKSGTTASGEDTKVDATVTDSFERKTEAGTLTIGYLGGVQGNFDMLSDANYVGRDLVYDKLVTMNPETLELEGVLAESWEKVDDTHIKFVLKSNATFSDGTPVTSEDVLYSLQRIVDQNAESMQLANWVDFAGCSIESDTEFTIATNAEFEPALYMLSGTNWACIMPKHWAESASADDFWANPVGSGPYKCVSNTDGVSTVYELREDYWDIDNLVTDVKKIEIKYYNSDNTLLLDYQDGVLDMCIGASASDLDKVESGELTDTVADLKWSNDASKIILSEANPTFDDIRIRQAISLAIDLDAFCEIVWDGLARPSTSLLSSTMTYYVSQGEHVYDPDQARALMEDAGYSDSNRLTLTMYGDSGETSQQGMTFLKEYLSQIYIDLDVNAVDVPVVIEHIITNTTDLCNSNASGIGTNTPYETFMSLDPAAGANPMECINNEEFVNLVHSATSANDSEEAADYYAQAQEWIYNSYYRIPTTESATVYLYRPYVTSVITQGDAECMTLRFVTMEG